LPIEKRQSQDDTCTQTQRHTVHTTHVRAYSRQHHTHTFRHAAKLYNCSATLAGTPSCSLLYPEGPYAILSTPALLFTCLYLYIISVNAPLGKLCFCVLVLCVFNSESRSLFCISLSSASESSLSLSLSARSRFSSDSFSSNVLRRSLS
jgi:hypothetical protein